MAIFLSAPLLVFLLFAVPAAATSIPADVVCNSSADCLRGYCEQGFCYTPSVDRLQETGGPCAGTRDCVNGYCLNGKCVAPAGLESGVLGFAVRPGCAGIATCGKSVLACQALCLLVWILAILLSTLSAYLLRESRVKLLPLAAFLVPLLVALITLPAFGFLLALLEVFAALLMERHGKSGKEGEAGSGEEAYLEADFTPKKRKTE